MGIGPGQVARPVVLDGEDRMSTHEQRHMIGVALLRIAAQLDPDAKLRAIAVAVECPSGEELHYTVGGHGGWEHVACLAIGDRDDLDAALAVYAAAYTEVSAPADLSALLDGPPG